MTELLTHGLLISIGINLLMFAFAYAFQTDKLTDFSYSLSFIAVAAYLFHFFSDQSLFDTLCFGLIVLWALRLGTYLFIRVHTMGRDKRFDGIREKAVSFLGFWLMQAITVMIILSAFGAVCISDNEPKPASYYFLGLAFLAILLEAVADYQKYKYKSRHPDSFMHEGLWKSVRHPNYLGEILFWLFLAAAIMTVSRFSLIAWVVPGPLWIIIILVFFSGIPPLEKKWKEKYGDDPQFNAYLNSSWKLIPFIF